MLTRTHQVPEAAQRVVHNREGDAKLEGQSHGRATEGGGPRRGVSLRRTGQGTGWTSDAQRLDGVHQRREVRHQVCDSAADDDCGGEAGVEGEGC